MRLWWAALALAACTPPIEEETGEEVVVVDTSEEDDGQPECDAPEVRVTGEDPPSVGDEWSIFLWCGDTLLAGAMVLRFDPTDIATLDENIATFVESGKATLYVQVGRYTGDRSVTVSE